MADNKESGVGWLTVLVWVLYGLAGVAAIIIGAIALASSSGYDAVVLNESDFAVGLDLWILVWGIAVVIVVLLALFAWWSEWAGFNYLAGIVAVFTFFPWLIIGQIIMLRRAVNNETIETAVFAMAIAALVLSYIAVTFAVAGTAGTIKMTGFQFATLHFHLIDNNILSEKFANVPIYAGSFMPGASINVKNMVASRNRENRDA